MREGALIQDPKSSEEVQAAIAAMTTSERLEVCKAWYLGTRNPLYVWAAIETALDAKETLPPFAAEYLTRCARALAHDEPESTDKPANRVIRALELGVSAGPSRFAQKLEWSRRFGAMLAATFELERQSALRGEDAIQRDAIIDEELKKHGFSLELLPKWLRKLKQSRLAR